MVADKVECLHALNFLFGGLLLEFGLGKSFLEIWVPLFLESLGWDKFAVFNSSGWSVDWSVSFLLDFLIDFSNFPGEIFFVEIFVILRDEGIEMLGDEFFLRLFVGVEFEWTV